MSNTKLLHLRSFLTERLTTAAVEIFGEIETIVEAYYEENKRLRNVLHMVLNPEIKLSKIDVGQYSGATQVREQPCERRSRLEQEILEPLPKKPKEEPIEYDISQVIEFRPDSSGTLEPRQEENCSPSVSDVITDNPQLHKSEQSTSQSLELQKPDKMSTKNLTKQKFTLQKTMLELQRRMPHKPVVPSPVECHSFLKRLTEAFKDCPEDKKPLITKMGLTKNVELVDSAFGQVPKGSPLSYVCPEPSSRDYKSYDDAPPRPLLPLANYSLDPIPALPILGAKEQEHMDVMHMTWEEARNLEQFTRGRKEEVEELRNLRLTSRFREICNLKQGRSNAEHLVFKIQKGLPEAPQIEKEMRLEALREYCKKMCVNFSTCGLVVQPSAPWLGALPDGLVYDPKEMPSYGLVHIKMVSFPSFNECKFLICQNGALKLKRNHSTYWQIQGEMMVTGTEWCDLLVFSKEDMLVQRIYRDTAIIKVMKKKLDDFFFYYYLPCLFKSDGMT
ncbi:Methionyl-tRNA formyltransferase [Dissostichus eleginoides]|uniref:Methionyl-tRNA formyltransferase n=1 Tax=Dissostichus eleginoides TaxID=100907 RepID=A0AAD9FGR6_DISEL|nr:Methionyl-tRNA formyltransferase [Dissostichus eleginoides]